MKKLLVFMLSFLLLVSCSNSEDKEKIKNLENKISSLEKELENKDFNLCEEKWDFDTKVESYK